MKEALNSRTVSTVLQWIAKQAKDKSYKFWTLAHHITTELLQEAYRRTNKDAAVGVDQQTAREYEENLSANVQALHQRLKEQKYQAPPVKRVWIPKGNGDKLRPLGIPTVEDKIVQQAVAILLEEIYEKDFYDFSYGYRRGRNCHQAVESIWQGTMKGMQWIIDADISDYFTSIDHSHLRNFLGERISDQAIIRLIGKWLNAGVLEDESLTYPERGTPQGGVISPLLANIYLHYVLDKWVVEEVARRLRGKIFLVRVADDFVIGCETKEDAQKLMEVLPKRLAKYGLKLNIEKTRLLDFRRPTSNETKGKSTFDFVGFTHYWGKSRKGYWVVKRKTATTRLHRALKRINDWARAHMHCPLTEQYAQLQAKLRGHYNYYGITGNCHALQTVKYWAERFWHYWLNRRGDAGLTWTDFREKVLKRFPLPAARVVHSIFRPMQLCAPGM